MSLSNDASQSDAARQYRPEIFNLDRLGKDRIFRSEDLAGDAWLCVQKCHGHHLVRVQRKTCLLESILLMSSFLNDSPPKPARRWLPPLSLRERLALRRLPRLVLCLSPLHRRQLRLWANIGYCYTEPSYRAQAPQLRHRPGHPAQTQHVPYG